MKKNLTGSLLALAVIVFIAAGCGMLKNSEVKNTSVNSVSSNTVSPNTPDAPPSPSTNAPSGKAIAWNLADKLSMAAILYDLKGAETSDSLSKAKILAAEVGAVVPMFPIKTGEKSKDTAAILAYLLNDVGKNVGGSVKTKYGQKEAALFEMSLKSNVLLMLYAPGDSMGKTVAKVVRSDAKAADLPENLWLPTVTKIESGASFDDVKDAIMEMHTDVSQYLAK